VAVFVHGCTTSVAHVGQRIGQVKNHQIAGMHAQIR
jgi:hypothetical protein